jgi:hypothetical protein
MASLNISPWAPKKLKRCYGKDDLHYITFGRYHRFKLLGSARARNLFARALDEVRRKYAFRLVGYAVMPGPMPCNSNSKAPPPPVKPASAATGRRWATLEVVCRDMGRLPRGEAGPPARRHRRKHRRPPIPILERLHLCEQQPPNAHAYFRSVYGRERSQRRNGALLPAARQRRSNPYGDYSLRARWDLHLMWGKRGTGRDVFRDLGHYPTLFA